MNAKELLDNQYLEMRWRCLSLAADLDRIERAVGGATLLASDPRIKSLGEAMQTLVQPASNRAERVQMILSDKTPAPAR